MRALPIRQITITTLAMILISGSAQGSVYNDAVLSKSPLLYWTFDESGSTSNAASLTNAAPENELAAQGDASRVTSNIGLGRAASLGGAGNFYAADLFGATVHVVPSQLWAAEFWFNPATSSPQYISESRRGVNTNDPAMVYGFNLVGGSGPNLEFYNSSGFGGGGPVAVGQWHHVVVAFYGNNSGFNDNLREVYVDGLLTASDATSSFSSGHSLAQFSIGANALGGDSFTGNVDEYAIYDIGTDYPDLNARKQAVFDIAQHYLLATNTENPPSLELVIDRGTGQVRIENNTGTSVRVKGYSITSAAGALNPANWRSVTQYYDVDGPLGGAQIGSVDANDDWTILTDVMNPTNLDLRESETGGDGGLLNNNAVVNLGSNVWYRNPHEDIAFEYTNDLGELESGIVKFIGNGGQPFQRSDLDFNGALTSNDWTLFISKMSQDLSGLSIARAYQAGDLTGDGANNLEDFSAFKADYDAANGVGAFAAMAASVPEPTAAALATLGGVGVALLRRKRAASRRGFEQSSRTKLWSVAAATIVAATISPATSQAALYGLYRFEDGPTSTSLSVGQTLADSSGRENNGSVFSGTIDIVTGKPGFGTAAQFGNGVGAATLSGIGNTVDDFSVAFWIRAAATPGALGESYVTARNAATAPKTQISAIYDYADDAVELFSDDAPDPRPGTQFMIQDGNWHHIVYTRTGGDYDAYFNGVKTDLGTLSGTYSNVPELIGLGGSPTGGGQNLFSGSLDDVAWFDNGLNQTQVSKVMAGDFSDFAPLLTIDVFTASGQIFLRNKTAAPITFDGYSISSDGSSLSPTAWISLSDQNINSIGAGVGQSWDEGGGSNAKELSEGYLLGSSTLAPGQSLDIGRAYNGTVNAQDIEFRFSSSNEVLRGVVNYIVGDLPGDFNGDNNVNGSDFLLWQRNLNNQVPSYASADANGDAIVDGRDLAVWKRHFGLTVVGATAAATTVPEPAAGVLFALAVVSLAMRRRETRTDAIPI